MLDDLSVETVDRGTTPDLPLFPAGLEYRLGMGLP